MNERQQLIKVMGDNRGASAVEFAIIAPLLLTFLFGIIAFGAYLAVVHGVQQLAAEAARSSVAGITNTERSSLAQNYVTANAGAYPLILPEHLSVSAAPSPSSENVFVVTLTYDASTMFIYSLPNFFPLPSSNIVRQAAIQRGGY